MTMNLTIDRDNCTSCGDCVLSAPEVFDLDDNDAKVVLLVPNPPESMRVGVQQAVRDCPVRVIHLADA